MRSIHYLSFLISLTLGSPVARSQSEGILPNHVVTQFPEGTWIENLAVRSNGNLLLTSLLPNASVYEVSNPTHESPAVSRRFTIDSVSSLLGITETTPDVFAIIGGNFSATAGGIKGSYGVWKADFSKKGHVKPELVTHIPEALLLNGATTVPQNQNLVLIADSELGLVWRVDIRTGRYSVAANVTEMGSEGSAVAFSIGINGLHIHDDYLWWTNKYLLSVFKVKFTDQGVIAKGATVETVSELSVTALDDFTFGPGNKDIAWVCTNSGNTVLALKPNGKSIVVAGGTDSDEVAVSTAAKFGRTSQDNRILYVTTGAGVSTSGKVQAIDTSGF
ncbi:hypothetical protein G7Z17_g62 [Cylindrodendrum hubeiense]|uniref:Uncharacterized protein n=1 Tax=Cylindrodendrum hubeiense TaxID=595255 RepID=A0A9P5HMC4_9HYPO|nr:hypothetical protein G7Z17_g62 [Cylindrodendrum hubeiense]